MRKLIINLLSKKNNRLFIFLFCLNQIIFLVPIDAQTVSIQGNINLSANTRYKVKNALVTFIDNADTNNQYTATTDESGNYQIGLPTSVESNQNNLPTKFELAQNYPNPFSTVTAIPYQIKKESNVRVTIYDILGRVVKQFSVGQQSIGAHDVLWDGRNGFGQKVASGVYFYRLSANGETQVKKMVFNESSSASVSFPAPYSSPKPRTNLNKQQNIKEGYYTIRVGNTNNTTPMVVSEQADSVHLQNDTTINISVDYISTASIDYDSLHQIIRGFGGANIRLWRPDMTDSEIQTAFGTGDGQLGLTILRIMLEADSTRWGLYVSTAKKALGMGAIVIASPWYAPNNMVESSMHGTTNISRVRHDMYSEYAAHLNSFVTYMKNNGVPIYGISIQNEPDSWGQWTNWEPNEMFTFMKYYADSIKGAKVMDPESFNFDKNYSDPILNDSAAAANTDIICGHIYGNGLASYPLAEQKGKEVWMTEYLVNSGNPPTNLDIDTGWTGAMQLAESINDCMNADMNTYIYWYIVRYYGLIADGTYANRGEVTKKGYVMSQFARFIRPGYYRVEGSIAPPSTINNVSISSYKDSASSKLVLVAINNGITQAKQVFRIQNGAITTFTPYTTSATKNCEKGSDVTVTNGMLTVTLDSSSITTFVSK